MKSLNDYGLNGHVVPQVAASETAKRTSLRELTRSPKDAVPRERLPKNSCSKRCSERKMAGLPEDMRRQIEARLQLQSHDNRVSCSTARGIAAELGVAAHEVGSLADFLDIRIKQCQLGCF